MPSPLDQTKPIDLAVGATLPLGLSGHLIGVGRAGVVHRFHFDRGRVSHLARSSGLRGPVRSLVAFDGSVLVHTRDGSVHQLGTGIGNPRLVDLAGGRRPVTGSPIVEPSSGELHLVARNGDGSPVHVVIPAGALTRRHRPITGAPASVAIHGLAIGPDHVAFIGDRAIGIAPRDGEEPTSWTATGPPAPHPVHTHRHGGTVELTVLTPALERWHLHLDHGTLERGTLEREVLDPAAQRFAHAEAGGIPATQRAIWTAGGDRIGRHDAVGHRYRHLSVAPHRPGDFAIVADAAHPNTPGAGWLIGFVHHATADACDLRVIDTADVGNPTLATIAVPRPEPPGLRCAWVQPPSS